MTSDAGGARRLGELLPVAVEAAALAAGLIRTRAPGVLTAKGDRDLASEVDFAVEHVVRGFLAERTPEVDFLGEEEGHRSSGAEFTWVLDPVDGTVNFVRGIPLCAVSLALVHGDRPVLGVIELPFLGGRYTAVEGQGAFVDGRPLAARRARRLDDAVVAVGDYAVGPNAAVHNAPRLAVTARLAARVQRVRMLGTAAVDLAWVAEGRVDALVMLANNPWDTAAGVVLAREAGARVTDADGTDHTLTSQATIAAAGPVLDELLALLRDADPVRTGPDRPTG